MGNEPDNVTLARLEERLRNIFENQNPLWRGTVCLGLKSNVLKRGPPSTHTASRAPIRGALDELKHALALAFQAQIELWA